MLPEDGLWVSLSLRHCSLWLHPLSVTCVILPLLLSAATARSTRGRPEPCAGGEAGPRMEEDPALLVPFLLPWPGLRQRGRGPG